MVREKWVLYFESISHMFLVSFLLPALANAHNDYILNGDNVIHTEPTKINVKGAMMQYSGPGHMIERINTTMMIAESLKVYVSSGLLYLIYYLVTLPAVVLKL